MKTATLDTSNSDTSRADSTRNRILKAALNLFGRFGFSAVSVRQICDEAEVNIAAINYHFEGKENLYVAVDKYISDDIEEDMRAVFAPAQAFLQSGSADPIIAIEHLLKLHARLIELIVPDSEESEQWARFYVRNQLGEGIETACASGQQIQMLIVALIGIAREDTADARTNGILAATFFGQILIFRIERATILTTLKLTSLTEAEAADVTDIVLNNIRAILASQPASKTLQGSK